MLKLHYIYIKVSIGTLYFNRVDIVHWTSRGKKLAIENLINCSFSLPKWPLANYKSSGNTWESILGDFFSSLKVLIKIK